MTSVLIVFDSRYGQGQKIASFAAEVARRRGLDAEVRHAKAAEHADVAAHPAIIVVAPIYFGRHTRAIAHFMRDHADILSRRQTAFISVSNSAASSDPAMRAQVARIAESFVSAVGVRARLVFPAGGALAYPRYGFLLRYVMKRIALKNGGSQDTSRVHELTDWRSVDEVLSRFLDEVAGERRPAGTPRPASSDEAAELSGVHVIREHDVAVGR